ncbi:MAG: hypothetical protein IJ849_07780 [Selenomonadaceae bacterium]|nr:hypothetical protein [Selenomonadaceae bacterium]
MTQEDLQQIGSMVGNIVNGALNDFANKYIVPMQAEQAAMKVEQAAMKVEQAAMKAEQAAMKADIARLDKKIDDNAETIISRVKAEIEAVVNPLLTVNRTIREKERDLAAQTSALIDWQNDVTEASEKCRTALKISA